MKDEQTIKALSELTYGGHSCIGCTYKVDKGEERCGVKGCNIARCAIDLVERQREMIEALINGQITLQKMYAEAIKKFAEKIKERKYQSSDWSHGEHPFVVEEDDIDDVLWKMTEGSNEV